MRLFKFVFITGCLLSAGLAWSQSSVESVKVDGQLIIDGEMTEDAWRQAQVIEKFYQREPDTGAPVTEDTRVYILYNEDYLYFGFKCFDDPEDITAKELARDVSLGEDDRVQIILDTFMDKRTGFWFQIGPRGSIGDALVSENGAAFNKQWDGLWEGKATIHENGWDAEVAIPFKTLSFRQGQTTWGLKIIRHVKRKLESAYWPVANLDTYRFQVSDAGELTGLTGITQGIGLDISPYALTGIDQAQGVDNDYPAEIGLDAFYQITPGLKSALTVNTDFAQTEVDARQINLTRFALFFPEKRDFFLDGANYFNFGINGDRGNEFGSSLIPFFSRRMGLDELGNPVPIIAGGKVTGQSGDWNLGFLDVVENNPEGKENLGVARITKNFGGQSMFGAIGTAGNSLGTADNYLYGGDLRLGTSEFQGNKNLTWVLFGLQSQTEGMDNNQHAYGSMFVYPNDFLSFRLGFHEIGENFRAGMGFVPRVGIRQSYSEMLIGPRPNRWGILQARFGYDLNYITDMNSRLLTREIELTPVFVEFVTGDEIKVDFGQQYEYLDQPFEITDTNTISVGTYEYWRPSIRLTSAQRRNFWASLQYQWGDFFNGSRNDIELGFGYKVAVPFYVGMDYEQSNVSLPDGDFSAEVYRLAANVLFSPDVTLYNFIQYDNFSERMGWQSRFRWILKPGNEIIFVWNSISADPLERFEITQSSTRLKLRYNYRF